MARSLPHDDGERIPPLENGDCLTRVEFERRYKTMPGLKKAELVEGVVHVPSPVRQRLHGRPHHHLSTWLGVYEASTPGVEGGDNSTIRLDLRNEPQPDALLFIAPEFGGQVSISPDDYIEGAPELLAEISASTVSIDSNSKLDVYERTGVREYIVWRVLEQSIDWFVLRNQHFEPLLADADGYLKSIVFPGLWLDRAALLDGNLAAVIAVAQKGLSSPEHYEFVQHLERLQKASKKDS